MTKHITGIIWATALLATTSAQEPTVIEGRVVDMTDGHEAAPHEPVVVWYAEAGIDHEPISTRTDLDGRFYLDIGELGDLGLLYVRETGYNSAVLSWPTPVDRDIVLRLTRPVTVYGRVVNASGMPVSGATLKWGMPFDGRLTSGTAAAAPDGSFAVPVPGMSGELRLVAWADLYAPTEAKYTYKYKRDIGEETPVTTMISLEDLRDDTIGRTGDPQYLREWVDEILAQEHVTGPVPR